MTKNNPMNPYTDAQTETQRTVAPPLAKAKVVQAASHDRDDEDNKGYHTARVRVYGESSATVAPIITSMQGDAHVPPVGSDVVVMYGPNEKPWILGYWYPTNEDVEPPNYQPGERVIGSPESESFIRFANDGRIEIITEGFQSVDIDKQTVSVNLNNANQTVPDTNTDVVEFDTVEQDNQEMWDQAAHHIKIRSDGIHRITASVALPTPGQNNEYALHIYKNGTPIKRVSKQSVVNLELSIQVTTLEELDKGDEIDVRFENNSGSAVDILGSEQTTDFTLRREGI